MCFIFLRYNHRPKRSVNYQLMRRNRIENFKEMIKIIKETSLINIIDKKRERERRVSIVLYIYFISIIKYNYYFCYYLLF